MDNYNLVMMQKPRYLSQFVLFVGIILWQKMTSTSALNRQLELYPVFGF